MYRKPHHKFLQKFPVVDVSQVAMCGSLQISERVTGEGIFANVILFITAFFKSQKISVTLK